MAPIPKQNEVKLAIQNQIVESDAGVWDFDSDGVGEDVEDDLFVVSPKNIALGVTNRKNNGEMSIAIAQQRKKMTKFFMKNKGRVGSKEDWLESG